MPNEFPQPDDNRVTRFDPGSIFLVKMQMIRTRTLSADVFIALLFLFPVPSQVAHAQEVPCDNSQAESLIPRNEKGQPLMPKEIQDDTEIMKKLKNARLTKKAIRQCLESNEPLKNHVIDFDEYAKAWKEIEDPTRALLIENSVLWSFKAEGHVNLAAFTKKTKEADGKVSEVVAGKIKWHNVTLGPLFFSHAVKFPPSTSFNKSRFPSLVSFSESTFGDKADFSEATFGGSVFFDSATFGDDADFSEATFGDYVLFFAVSFGDYAFFNETTFCNRGSFIKATFGDNALFAKATFGDGASFLTASFGGDISLQSATVKGELDLTNTTWEGRADFRKAEIQDLSWKSKYHSSGIKGVFDAREAKFKKAVIKDIHFSDLVDFSDVEFGGPWKFSSDKDNSKTDSCGREADEPSPGQSKQKTQNLIFQNLIFEKEVDFLRATFWKDAIFIRNRFYSAWDLTGVKFRGQKETKNPHLCLSFNRINKLFMENEHLGYESSWTEDFFPDWRPLNALKKSQLRGVIGDGPYSCSNFSDKPLGENEKLWEIYKSIESSFREANDRLAENEAWYLSLVAKRESQYPDMMNWGLFILVDFPSRYGIDLYRVVLVSVGLMLVFAIVYWCYLDRQIYVNKWRPYVKLKLYPDQKRAFRFRPFERFFQNGEKQVRPLHPLKDALFLSGRAFFKLGLGTAYPRTRMLVGIASFEWVVGMYMLIHFLLAVKNTLPIAVPFFAVAG